MRSCSERALQGRPVLGRCLPGCTRAARYRRANFFPVGIAHSIVGGTAWEPTPWRGVQRAAWEVLKA
jgi:hypothetical protein